MTKYNNRKVYYDGKKFDSKAERDYYIYLRAGQKAGKIIDIECQVPFELQPGYKYPGMKRKTEAINYIADFVVTFPNGDKEVIDVKGYATEVYKLKKKMLLFRYPNINFREIKIKEIKVK